MGNKLSLNTANTPIVKAKQEALIKAQKFQDAVAAIVATGDKPFVAMQAFTALLNLKPKPSDISIRNGHKYIPIGILEARLDQFFFGDWETTNFTYQREFNEMIGSIELICTNPITGKEMRRTGAASIQIMQDAKTKVNQFNDHKKPNALEAGFPKLKAECFTNAVKGLGNIFGRNLNRDKFDDPTGIIPEEKIDLNVTPEKIEDDEQAN